MAKGSREKDEDAVALPGLDELLHGPKEEPKPRPKAGPAIPDEDLLGPLPQPGEAPRPDAVKVRVKAGTGPESGKGPTAKKGPPPSGYDRFKAKVGPYLIPQDPVDRMRYKLRWLGLTRYIFVPIIAVTISVLVMTYLWYLFWDYNDHVMVYSRHVWTVVFLVPAGLGLALAIYLPVSILLLNHYEYRWNRTLRDMLRGKIPTKGQRPAKPKEAPKEPPAPEPPLPQPTVNS